MPRIRSKNARKLWNEATKLWNKTTKGVSEGWGKFTTRPVKMKVNGKRVELSKETTEKVNSKLDLQAEKARLASKQHAEASKTARRTKSALDAEKAKKLAKTAERHAKNAKFGSAFSKRLVYRNSGLAEAYPGAKNISLKRGMSLADKFGLGLGIPAALGAGAWAGASLLSNANERAEKLDAINDEVAKKSAGTGTTQATEKTDTVPTDTTATKQNADLSESPATAEKAPSNATATIPDTHTVKDGDSLSAIAKNYGLTLQQLLERNDIEDPEYIRVGQTINLDPNGEKQKITGTFKKKKKKAAPAPTERRDVEEDGYYRTRPNKHGTEESYEDRRARAQREVEAYTNYRLARNKGEVEANKYYDDGEWLDQFDFR